MRQRQLAQQRKHPKILLVIYLIAGDEPDRQNPSKNMPILIKNKQQINNSRSTETTVLTGAPGAGLYKRKPPPIPAVTAHAYTTTGEC